MRKNKEELIRTRPVRIRKLLERIIPACKIAASQGKYTQSFEMTKGMDYYDWKTLEASLTSLGYDLNTTDGVGCLSEHFSVNWHK
jgi:hypothetical protein